MRNFRTIIGVLKANRGLIIQIQPVALLQHPSKRLNIALFQTHWLHIGQV